MRRILSILVVVCMAGGVLSARTGMQQRGAAVEPTPQTQQTEQRKEINFKADLSGPIAPGDSAIFLVGNFAAQHNGAVITCDSAVRYSPDRFEFFGNVLINKNTTYVYGDRADYNGLTNEAHVYSDLIKVVDGDATLFTYQFVFNTKTNIGRFWQGGVLVNRDNLVEADRGYYYSNTKDLICVDRVQMRNDEYQMKGDSVIYNLNTDHAYYFDRTNIWSKDGDYLYADRGEYNKQDTLYKATRNSYVLTAKQEVWSDTIDYYSSREHVIMRGNLQLDETEHKTLAFGDYGEYWKTPGNAVLTRRPSMVNYDPEQQDSLFMRADSMFLFTYLRRDIEAADAAKAAAAAAAARADSIAAAEDAPMKSDVKATVVSTTPGVNDATPKSGEQESTSVAGSDSTRIAPDSLRTDLLPADSLATDSLATEKALTELTPAERKAKLREAALKQRQELKAAAEKEREIKLDSIADRRQAKTTAKLLAQEARDKRALEARRAKAAVRLQKQQARAILKGRAMPDSSLLSRFDSLIAGTGLRVDSLAVADSMAADSGLLIIPLTDSLDSLDTLQLPDTIRIVKAYRHVRTFRIDFQSVCDSLMGTSRDSTLHLYIDPVLWNESNQITSDVMDIFTKNQQIVRAEFVGQPMMVSQIDTAYYNQVAGKQMEAFFSNNKIYRNDVNGNAQTIYYIQEEGDPEVKSMAVIESGNISFYIDDDNKIHTITYRNDVNWNIYPLNKIPPEQDSYLKNFKWQGDRRPTRDDVFDRKIRPSERKERERLARPHFPLTDRLERDKKRFAEWGWSDRNDLVTPEIDEWMRSLGFSTGQPRKQ